MDEDERFSHIKNDPRFRSIPKREKKIQIDKRFTTMFHNKGFQLNYFMDKRGRPVQKSMSEDLRKYYELDSEASDSENQGSRKINGASKKMKRKLNKYEEKKEDIDSGRDSSVDERDNVAQPQGKQFLMKKGTKSKKRPGTKAHSQKTRSSDDEDQEEAEVEKARKKDEDNDEEQEEVASEDDDSDASNDDGESEPDIARGEGNVESSSSDESSDGEEEEEEETGFDHKWGETDKTVTRSEDVSCRLALCNMDWDRIKAEDLYVLFNNFKPPQGIIHSVKIYPSEYGIQRMKEEEVHGPKELTSRNEEMEDQDGSKYHMESLRQYQLNRLRYYYAVVDCDCVETASTLYNELDGREYESSASQLDLRYIPDSMVFDQEPKSVADKLPDMSVYTPVLFTTKALQQTMVELTWDETNPNRLRTLEKAFNDETENLNADLRAYLASSSSSSSEDEMQDTQDKDEDEDLLDPVKEKHRATDRISKYKKLLASIEEDENKKKQKDIEMEITWEPGLKDRTENLIKMKQQKQEMSYFENYLEKKKEAKKQRRKDRKEATELPKGSDDLCDDDDVPSDIDVNDPFFQDEINSMKVKKTFKKNKMRGTSKTEEEHDVNSKAELELLLMDEGEDGRKHFNLKNLMEEETLSKRKRKKLERTRIKEQKSKTEDDFKINTEDPRFSAIFQSADYNIDPSDTHFKKTKAMESLLQEKQKQRAEKRFQVTKDVESEESPKRKMDPSLSYLVKSVKNKAQNFKRRKD